MWEMVLETVKEEENRKVTERVGLVFDSDRDLGIFLQNYDKNRGKIRRIGRPLNYEKVGNSLDFIKREPSLELGKEEEVHSC